MWLTFLCLECMILYKQAWSNVDTRAMLNGIRRYHSKLFFIFRLFSRVSLNATRMGQINGHYIWICILAFSSYFPVLTQVIPPSSSTFLLSSSSLLLLLEGKIDLLLIVWLTWIDNEDVVKVAIKFTKGRWWNITLTWHEFAPFFLSFLFYYLVTIVYTIYITKAKRALT